MYFRLKRKIFEIIQPAAKGCIASKIFDIFIIVLILLSVISVFSATFELSDHVVRILGKFEVFTVTVFSLEYLLRFWTADLLYPELSHTKARLRYIRSTMAMIDLIAILPFYLPMILPINLLGLRSLRLIRLLRILKLNRYSDALSSIGKVIQQKSEEIFASLFFVAILLVIASLLIYHVEHDAQPDKFQNARGA